MTEEPFTDEEIVFYRNVLAAGDEWVKATRALSPEALAAMAYRGFGESKIEEALEKYEKLAADIRAALPREH